jgi:hypothetical protein
MEMYLLILQQKVVAVNPKETFGVRRDRTTRPFMGTHLSHTSGVIWTCTVTMVILFNFSKIIGYCIKTYVLFYRCLSQHNTSQPYNELMQRCALNDASIFPTSDLCMSALFVLILNL